ncbi:hypothetical protein [Chitinimonas taiwanensis]|uniref:Uncharacterized protein n=1 Tax=Chitinimonas taiwanensis DSM 18899 TaxID=1121279 RepID=A0A1K2HL05_9NEIS|nr:hypothetical protein [Chitinimonas taiwanensis]SFZ77395.1 hypothetical protein SAMN02745887_02399 [Chitinimonas taiwanensis DSM 18899]
MAREQSNTATTNAQKGSCVDCPVSVTRRVSYRFETGLWDPHIPSERTLNIPYALAIDGKADKAFSKKAAVLKAYVAKDDIFVEPGQTVALYLNSDAAPANRKHPVFAVTPKEHDIEVVIKERRGQLGSDDTPKLKGTKEITDARGNKRKVDVYEATLTGDIWFKVSYKYTLDDAKRLMPPETVAEIRAAVLSIFDGSLKGELTVNAPNDQGVMQKTILTFQNADNPVQNIANFDMYRDGLPRVHPHAWLALIDAALKSGIKKVITTSGWRPMYGSISHRTGLSLDVGYLDNVLLNRQELRGGRQDVKWVSDAEKQLFKEKELADKAVKAAEDKRDSLIKEQNNLNRLKKSNPGKVDPLRERALENELTDSIKNLEAANQAKVTADNAWNKERDLHEPTIVKSFRTSLSQCKCVSQVFDPWFMDDNTRDQVPSKPNLQISSNEKLHSHHLHITVYDPSLPTK